MSRPPPTSKRPSACPSCRLPTTPWRRSGSCWARSSAGPAATTTRRDGPFLTTLLGMLRSSNVAERRAAANAFHMAGTSAGPFVAELKAALASETDSATRSRLRSAIERAQTRL